MLPVSNDNSERDDRRGARSESAISDGSESGNTGGKLLPEGEQEGVAISEGEWEMEGRKRRRRRTIGTGSGEGGDETGDAAGQAVNERR